MERHRKRGGSLKLFCFFSLFLYLFFGEFYFVSIESNETKLGSFGDRALGAFYFQLFYLSAVAFQLISVGVYILIRFII